MAFVVALLNALVAIPKIAAYVEMVIDGIVQWQIQRKKAETLAALSDAIALVARAKSQEERYAAAKKLQEAMAAGRVVSS